MSYTKTAKQRMAEFPPGYNVTVTGRHVHVTEAMKSYALEKLSKLERVGTTRIVDVNVIMDIQKLDHRVEIILKYGHTLIVSRGSSTDMYASIDMAIEKLQGQLTKYKRRLKEHHAKEHPVEEVPVTIYSREVWVSDEEEVNCQIEAQSKNDADSMRPHQIVSRETQALKILTDDEAIMKMELSDLPCMVFRAEESRKLKVIYRLADGNFGVIQPE